MRSPAVICELGRDGFVGDLDSLVAIYTAAMRPEPAEVLGRRHLMQRHSGNPGFRALAALDGPAGAVVGFAYGFHGTPGQWWHDIVLSGVTAAGGQRQASAWLANAMEIAEVHVHPEHQRRGTGHGMLLTLTGGRPERTAVLSTRDTDSTARRLYRGLGFTDLLTGYIFPGGGPAYAIMGAVLPLSGEPRRLARPSSV